MESTQPDSDPYRANGAHSGAPWGPARTEALPRVPVEPQIVVDPRYPVEPPPPGHSGPSKGYPRWQIAAIAIGVLVVVLGSVGLAVMSRKDKGAATNAAGVVTSAGAANSVGPAATASAPAGASASAKASASASASAKAKASASAKPKTESAGQFGNFPNANNTGVPAGVTLKKKSGDITVTKKGTVIDGIELTGCISVNASNVTIKRSRIKGSCAEGTIGPHYNANYTNLLIEDVEVDGLDESNTYSVVAGTNFTCRRCNLHGGGTGIRAGSNVVVEDSWLHGNHVGGESHNTAMSIHGGSNITIRHNWLQCDGGWNCSSALSLYTPDGAIDHVLVDSNLFSGGGYCVYGGVYNRDTGLVAAKQVRFLNNGFLKNQWPKCGDLGPVAGWDVPVEGNVWSGNYWYPDRNKKVEP
ncbi:hypothetical protein ACIA5D_41200 [Actinoplanes sp. NPDC051513]|uniref:hypothetical protein n=1 Tax=Actinoplanes sp. NPDC051513 TaxID=3363908 RepID=UPI0037A20897